MIRIYIVGLVRNCEKNLQIEIDNLMSCFEFAQTKFFIVESDSSDNTILILEKLRDTYTNLDFISLGNLATKIPNRVSRITFCRNTYMKRFYQVRDYYDYLAVVDLDGVNKNLTKRNVEHAIAINNWSMISANQSGPYYDLWALRANNWLNHDCHESFRIDLEYGVDVRRSYFYNFIRPMFIARRTEKIEVLSAFGGLAIYRSKDLKNFFYSELSDNGEIQCEHVNFNRAISESGGRLFIIPGLCNAGWTVNAKRSVIRFIGILIFGKTYFSIFKKHLK